MKKHVHISPPAARHPRRTPWLAGTAAAIALVLAASTATAAESDHYSKERPYGNPRDTPHLGAPKGYSLFFLQTVGRHGARSMVDDNHEDHVIDLARAAEKKNALTDVGKSLKRDVERFQSAERSIGYGDLSGLGRDEMRGIGRRTAANYAKFFAKVKKDKLAVLSLTTEVDRTKQSVAALRDGIRAQMRSNLDGILKSSEVDDALKFNHDPSSTGKRILDEIERRPSLRKHAEHALRASFKASFVESIDDPVHASLDIFKLYATAPGMKKETAITFARYVPKEDRDALSFATDAKLFYEHGPGVKGETNTFREARPLLKDFFKRLDARIDGSKNAAVFRLAHGETTMPFAALIKAPGSQTQVPKSDTYSRKSNPWRASVAGRLSGNIEWTAFRHDRDKKNVLVTMRYNEQPVRFHSGCKPHERNGYFYRVSELKRCLN